MTKYIGYIGTYTKGNSEGIYSFILDSDTSKLAEVKLAAKLDNPTYLNISTDNRFLYSVVKDGDLGGVAAFDLNAETGLLTLLNSQTSAGSPPCHVSVGKDSKNVFSANYHKGTVESYLTEVDGSLLPLVSVIEHKGSGPDPRQEKSHMHYAAFTRNEKYLVAVDLGSDLIYTYEVTEGVLTEKARLLVKAGSGPRHLVFHPQLEIAYVMTEFSSEVIVLGCKEGIFTELQYISTLPSDFTENNQGSAIHISSDGKFVYAGNRGHNSIAVFAVNGVDGELSFVEHASTAGDWPRDFSLDPSEKFIVASNQESGNLVLFARDSISGELSLLQSDVVVPDPVCVKFVK